MQIAPLQNVSLIHPSERVSELESQVMASKGIPRVVPAALLESYARDDVRALMMIHGLYVFPTVELEECLRGLIDGRTAIEIGAGNGVMAERLGIVATDNYSQAPDFNPGDKHRSLMMQHRQRMLMTGTSPVTYGSNVLRQDGISAVIKHRPAVVLGQFITHQWHAGMEHGSVFGVEEHKLLKRADYIMVGNLNTHAQKPILARPHDEIELSGLITRAEASDLNRIFVFKKGV